jgi:hypothetical protein
VSFTRLRRREGKIVTRSEIKKRLWPNDTIVDHDHIINVTIRSQPSHNWKFTNRSRNMPSDWDGDARFHWLENRSEVLSRRDLAYAPVKRNSAAQGPSVWTTSQ